MLGGLRSWYRNRKIKNRARATTISKFNQYFGFYSEKFKIELEKLLKKNYLNGLPAGLKNGVDKVFGKDYNERDKYDKTF